MPPDKKERPQRRGSGRPIEKSPWRSAEDQERDRQLKRDALLRAAAIEFGEHGFRTTSLDVVAARLGIAKPTIYHYFSSKEEILYEIAHQSLGSMLAAIENIPGENGLERLRTLLIAYARTLTVDYGKCVIRTPEYDLAPEGRGRLLEMKREIDRTIRAAITEGMADGSIRRCDAKMAGFVVAGGLNWIARWHRESGPMTDEEVARSCVDILLDGLRPRNE